MSGSVNYFTSETVAARYDRSRPYLHPLVARRIEAACADGIPFARALDVGCGTGQSSRAIEPLAARVIGVDISPAMLSAGPRRKRIHRVLSPGEILPIRAESMDLATVGLAIHWLDRHAFLAEARRVLVPGGWLVIYNIWFRAKMRENPAFEEWFHTRFLERYPTPPRDAGPLPEEAAVAGGFEFVGKDDLEEDFALTREAYIQFTLTQSNIIAKACDEADFEAARAWLESELAPVFSRGTFLFGGFVCFLRRPGR